MLPYEKNDNVWVSITVEVDRDLSTYERTVYTMLDLLADVGGLQSILFAFCALLVAIWNYRGFETSLIAKLFKVKKQDEYEAILVEALGERP